MSVTQTYYLAHTARSKLSSEASRGDHDLRLLVGHANLLDSIMLELREAEREQDEWLERTVTKVEVDDDAPRHIVWRDTIIAEQELEFPDASDSDSDDGSDDSDYEEEAKAEIVEAVPRLRRMRSPPAVVAIPRDIDMDVDEEEYESDVEEDEDEDNAELTLVRTRSHSHQPPELIHDCSDSEEEDGPVTPPPQPAIDLSDVQIQSMAADYHRGQKVQQDDLHPFDPADTAMLDCAIYLSQGHTPMVTACC